jgi:uncharacterized protein
MSSRIGRGLRALLQVEGSPHRIALAFGTGIWIAFFPILGIHTGMALLIAFALRLNRPAILIGSYINNPWTVAPLYLAGTALGAALLGVSTERLGDIDFDLHGWAFYQGLIEHLRPFLWPFVLGNTILGVAGGLAGYFVLRTILERRRGTTAPTEASQTKGG